MALNALVDLFLPQSEKVKKYVGLKGLRINGMTWRSFVTYLSNDSRTYL